MIRIDCKQGDDVWRANRIGIPTVSQFDRLLTETTMKPSAKSKGLLYEKCGEWIAGEAIEKGSTAFMSRGKEFEDEGRNWYSFDRDVVIDKIGFALSDDRSWGGSPDGLIVGQRKGIEIKCLSLVKHIEAFANRNKPNKSEYRCQVQGYMMLCDLDEWDRVYYHPRIPSVVIPFERDDHVIELLGEQLETFNEKLAALKQEFLNAGCVAMAQARAYAARDVEDRGLQAWEVYQ